jgi:hypothetical protein
VDLVCELPGVADQPAEITRVRGVGALVECLIGVGEVPAPGVKPGEDVAAGSSTIRKRNGLAGSIARGRNTLSASALTSPWLMTPSAEPSAPSTVTSSSTCRWVADPARRIEPRSTLLSWRSIAQIARASPASGASRSLRMSSVAACSHLPAALIEATGAAPS